MREEMAEQLQRLCHDLRVHIQTDVKKAMDEFKTAKNQSSDTSAHVNKMKNVTVNKPSNSAKLNLNDRITVELNKKVTQEVKEVTTEELPTSNNPKITSYSAALKSNINSTLELYRVTKNYTLHLEKNVILAVYFKKALNPRK